MSFLIVFVLIILILIFSAALTAIIYLRTRKLPANQVFSMEKPRSTMAPASVVVFFRTIAILCIGVFTSIFAGYKLAYAVYKADAIEFSALDLQTFYAEVTEIGAHTISFKGLSLNEEKYRGDFQYEVWGETSIVRQDQPIALSDLKQGDLISVILITDKNAAAELFKIQLIASDS